METTDGIVAPLAETEEEVFPLTQRSMTMCSMDKFIEEYHPCIDETLEQRKKNENLKIITILKPLFIVGRLLGIVSTKPWTKNAPFLIILMSLLLCLIRVTTFFAPAFIIDSTFIATLLIFLYFFKGILSMYYLLRLLGSVSAPFFLLWEDIVQASNNVKLAKRMKFWTIFGLAYTLICATSSACAVFLNSFQIGFHIPSLKSILIASNLQFLNALLIFVAALYNYLCQTTYTLLCIMIIYEFDHLVGKLRSAKKETNEKLLYHLTSLRSYHYHIVKLTDTLNNLVSYYTFWHLFINVPMLFAAAYVLGSGQWQKKDILTLACCSVKVFLEILTISIPPSLISCAVGFVVCSHIFWQWQLDFLDESS